ncbi:efflux RND transporter periplasmic adaptor subunit [Ectothiorhodospira variabilis]|uniref:efflux RND transporter periplasmic adaptor subunit n=1 Tax=Ectothiorhodospira variabilis TaxID=505694 RepID=UPI001EFBDCB6|nr:efflux RND transporter periplasmic adaptor subunit [Ectothiorhodospira variabilis]MCG5494485.1 efflux RND transporter periplasmic adaptor subunit [Ectothiorhodospira variabilis]MCG5503144.1 efflux RND transporter periplasmic adaptor subunit [Ectothiorhodospira variabilis]MCG5506097.1 efflux RND transporter periplasmic adaptor subunit [Ectothiorhodospira variabilis]
MVPYRPPYPRSRHLAALSLCVTLILTMAPVAAQQGDRPPPPVTLQPAQVESVEVQGVYAGRARGSREVEVRARVGGILEERLYVEGQAVDRGEALFRIEEEPYQIALQHARAQQANAQAALNQAQREWDRISSLYARDAVSQRERDRALSEKELAEAQMEVAAAAVNDARRNLSYTRVEAPITGATELEVLPEGSLVERGTLLTIITQHDPIHIRFALPEGDAAVQRAARQARIAAGEHHRYEATLRLADGSDYEHTGTVDFTAGTIEPRTGSVTARAVFPNPDRRVVPGQFLRVRLVLERLEDVVVVDETVVSEGHEGPRVFVVDEDNVAHARNVTLGPVHEGRRVILEGLEPGEKVVVRGHVAVDDGMTVNPGDASGDEE